MDSNIEIGEHTYGMPIICGNWYGNKVKIGKFCSIANNVRFYIHDGMHNTKNITTFPLKDSEFGFIDNTDTKGFEKGDIEIGNDVWICDEVRVFSGVKIGNGAVIGAGSYVREDVPDYAIVIGNPAQIIKFRFSQRDIKELLEIKWWDWTTDKIKQYIHLLSSSDISTFLQSIKT